VTQADVSAPSRAGIDGIDANSELQREDTAAMDRARDALVLGGARTPIGRYGGSLSRTRTDDLLAFALRHAVDRVGIDAALVAEVAAGAVNVAHEGMGDIARWAALVANFPDNVPAYTTNRFCASSLTAAVNLANAIRVGELDVAVGAGVESMSRSGWAWTKSEEAFSPRGPQFLLDTMWAGAGGPPHPALLARQAYMAMIETAQKLADIYKLTREEIDAFALRSHQHAAAAMARGRFALEIAPIDVPAGRHATKRFEHDEFIRPDTSLEALAKLAPQPNTTQMTAGNSSPLSDGASAVVLASRARAEALGHAPMARVVASATVAVDPTIMGIAPAYAIPKAIARAGLQPEDIDVYEIHEAFAAQVLAVLREFKTQTGYEVPDDRLNPNGGAVALGHPFGDSGTRLVLTLATELVETGKRYGVIGVCVGSGQGVAVVLEREPAV
jgi:acetyl-CoA acetyltransferase family protein